MGALSQALTNLGNAVGQAGAITGLPPAAQSLRKDLVTQMNDIVHALQPLQGDVAVFVAHATPALTSVESTVATNPGAVATLSGISSEIVGVKAVVSGATGQTATIASVMTATLGKLSALESTLSSQLANLQSALPNAQRAAAAAHARMAMLAGSGLLFPFFAARTQYVNAQASVNATETTIATLQPQIAAIALLTSLFRNDIPTLVAKATAVENTADSLATTLPQLVAQGTASATAVGALLADVQTMGIDAS